MNESTSISPNTTSTLSSIQDEDVTAPVECDWPDWSPEWCRVGPETDFCSGRGECVCGECWCDQLDDLNKMINGPFCECDNFSCDR